MSINALKTAIKDGKFEPNDVNIGYLMIKTVAKTYGFNTGNFGLDFAKLLHDNQVDTIDIAQLTTGDDTREPFELYTSDGVALGEIFIEQNDDTLVFSLYHNENERHQIGTNPIVTLHQYANITQDDVAIVVTGHIITQDTNQLIALERNFETLHHIVYNKHIQNIAIDTLCNMIQAPAKILLQTDLTGTIIVFVPNNHDKHFSISDNNKMQMITPSTRKTYIYKTYEDACVFINNQFDE